MARRPQTFVERPQDVSVQIRTDKPSRGIPVSSPVRRALRTLVQAHYYAQDLNNDPRQFAVRLVGLKRLRLTENDLRWLLHKGYLLHAHEIAGNGQTSRRFRTDHRLPLGKRSCFVLTSAGLALAASLFAEDDSPPPDRAALRIVPLRPNWDSRRRELWFHGRLVKRFKVRSPNQEAILDAFEEENWPPQIADPLSPSPGIDPKRRLHDAIKNLNRYQKARLIQFMGDGTAEGVRWEPVAEAL